MFVETDIRFAFGLDCREKEATETLHYKQPVYPHGTSSLNVIGQMKKRMDRDLTCCQTFSTILIIVPIIYSVHE